MKIFFVENEWVTDGKTTLARLTEKGATTLVERADGARELRIKTGSRRTMTRRRLILAIRHVFRESRARKFATIAIMRDDFVFPHLGMKRNEIAELFGVHAEMANYEFDSFKTSSKRKYAGVETAELIGNADAEDHASLKRGQMIGREINACRDLANTPGGIMTPKVLTTKARDAVKGTGAKVSVWGRAAMKKIGMGAVLGVAQGSREEPQFIIVEYRGSTARERPIVLVGKGVTFDTGGVNLKTGDSMLDMHLDMSGGAAVLHSVVLAAKLGVKKNVVGLIPAVENMPSGSSYRPGDILTSLSGKTIEVLNTDAEGRIILADGIAYAARYRPRFVMTVATLTGASLVALGDQASAVMTRDQKVEDFLRRAGEESGEYVWPFPLWDEYRDMIKGNFGDVANIPAQGNSRYAGVIGGGMFLLQFTGNLPKDCSFAHVDMAPRMVAAKNEYLGKGAVGSPIRLLLKVIEEF